MIQFFFMPTIGIWIIVIYRNAYKYKYSPSFSPKNDRASKWEAKLSRSTTKFRSLQQIRALEKLLYCCCRSSRSFSFKIYHVQGLIMVAYGWSWWIIGQEMHQIILSSLKTYFLSDPIFNYCTTFNLRKVYCICVTHLSDPLSLLWVISYSYSSSNSIIMHLNRVYSTF